MEKPKQKSKYDIDWIFEHGRDIVKLDIWTKNTLLTLAKYLGLNYNDAISRLNFVKEISRPFLRKQDKCGFLDKCDKIKKAIRIRI